ncbi:MAG: AraC family transcriptional regulator [Aphanocapsa sp. GSE-SYN-MK-11-07L]|jgi:AraC-like DNA-binding protein|nr:AraC family transcriptional regulator [Aphanocapsa sp. GSE-SYN-MK-11-07L]
MTLTLTTSDWDELLEAEAAARPTSPDLDQFEIFEPLLSRFGTGAIRGFQVAPGLWLSLADWNFQQDLRIKIPIHEHPIQIMVMLSVVGETGIHPNLDKNRAYFSGGGLSPKYSDRYYVNQRLAFVNIEVEPELLESTFGELRSPLKSLLLKGEDWKASFYPKVTPAMRSLAYQIWNAPYQGTARQIYLYSKAWELLAMQIDLLTADQAGTVITTTLRPKTIACLHYAKEILFSHLEHPPLLSDLAQQVGVSERTLLRGFRQLFGMTPIQYLTQQRMEQAQQLLRAGNCTVAEAARKVGYGNLGYFAAAFRRQFGINPGECLKKQ